MSHLLENELYQTLNEVLRGLELDALHPDVVVAYWLACFPARSLLPARQQRKNDVEARLRSAGDSEHAIARTLTRLFPPKPGPVRALLEQLSALPEQAAVNLAIERVDDWLLEDRWRRINLLLRVIDPRVYPPVVLLALCSAAPVDPRLPARPDFVTRAETRAQGTRAEKLFSKFREP